MVWYANEPTTFDPKPQVTNWSFVCLEDSDPVPKKHHKDDQHADSGLDGTFWLVAVSLLIVVLLAIAIRKWGHRCIQRDTGKTF